MKIETDKPERKILSLFKRQTRRLKNLSKPVLLSLITLFTTSGLAHARHSANYYESHNTEYVYKDVKKMADEMRQHILKLIHEHKYFDALKHIQKLTHLIESEGTLRTHEEIKKIHYELKALEMYLQEHLAEKVIERKKEPGLYLLNGEIIYVGFSANKKEFSYQTGTFLLDYVRKQKGSSVTTIRNEYPLISYAQINGRYVFVTLVKYPSFPYVINGEKELFQLQRVPSF